MQTWECRDNGDLKEFLRMCIIRNSHSITIDQSDYLRKVLQRFNMTNAKAAVTPLPMGYIPIPNDQPVDDQLRQRYQQVIGSLLYLMLGTRPDIAYAVTKLSQYAANPSKDHLVKALYICRYLVGTADYKLVYKRKDSNAEGLFAEADSDWASDTTTCRSTTGYLLHLAGGVFSWNSIVQKTVALSSTEEEYM